VLLEEIRCPERIWAQGPRYVSVALTNACELNCPYCYAPKSKSRLESDAVVRWLSELSVEGSLGVGFGGGEPTLHPDFTTICRHIAKSTDLAVTFTTHGHRLDDRMLTELSGSVHFVRLSMDGVGSTYEVLRGRPFASFRRTLDAVREFSPFGINFVVNSDTLSDLDAAVAIASDAGAREFLLLPERPVRGRGGIDTHTRCALARWITHYRGDLRLAVSQSDAFDLPVVDPFALEQGLRAYAHIDASAAIRSSSYSPLGVPIAAGGVVAALIQLAELQRSA
jgi:MoaA/NifB/PqqE/SkfB family radical SAM enzyme